jgi:5-methylcytosine-specific restriction endonuclease McrA
MLVAKAPASRLFIGASCQAPGCDSSWVSYAAMPDCDYCSVCNPKRWRDNHRKRVKSGVEREHIDRHAIFERDGYRCQICGKKTRGKYPAPSSPSLDHIIPLSKGGSHTWDNVRCAHFGCNARKRAGAANDQMLLPIGPPTRDGGTG